MTPAELTGLLEVATAAAQEAGALLRGYAAQRLEVTTKTTTTDPVSEADTASERLIVARITEARPDDAILAEEHTDRRGLTGLRWVVDPLDGTVNFLYGIPQWAVSVACEDDDGPLVGVVYDPNRDETFAVHRGGQTTLDGRPVVTSTPADLAHTLVATGFAYEPEVRVAWGRTVAELLGVVRDVRRAGAAALDLAWVACGRVDAYVEGALSPWDWAAGRLLVEGAGGRATPCELRLAGAWRPALVASGPTVHDELVAWVYAHGGRSAQHG